MIDSVLLGILILLQLGVVFMLWRKKDGGDNGADVALRQELAAGFARLNQELRQELAISRKESAETAFREREERGQAAVHLAQTLSQQLGQLGAMQAERLEAFARELSRATQGLDERFVELRSAVESRLQTAQADNAGKLEEIRRTVDEKLHTALELRLSESFKLVSDTLNQQLGQLGIVQTERLEAFARELSRVTQGLDERFVQLRGAVESRLQAIQVDNAGKLEEMRRTVDEKLHATLEQRLGESFKLVSDRLDQVHRGLGEMQALATGVGDLKKVLSNVKTRGTWGEIQLGNLLEQILTVDQYGVNVATHPGSNDRVEFAIRLPGKEEEHPVWLPIDAKFPVEDYQRLMDAQERGDSALVEEASKAIETRLKVEARTIREKYVSPPHTTDFAILYLPTEGLYAEALRRPGLTDTLQREWRINLAGPTTLAALLNSLQMGFRTLAIEQRSAEVWKVLGAVKTEFGKFGEALAHTRKKLDEASNSIGKAETRTRVLSRQLREVEALPVEAAVNLLGVSESFEEGEA